MVSEGNREGLNEAALNRYNTVRPSAYSSPAAPPPATVTTAPSSGTSAAASFFARAAQKLNLSAKKKKQRPAPPVACDPPLFPTNFSGILQVSPPPAPPCLLRAVNKVKDTPGMGKVKVMVRVCPSSPVSAAESSSFLKVDSRKKQVTIMDPAVNSQQNQTQKRGSSNQVPPKMFAFDAAFSHDASQVKVMVRVCPSSRSRVAESSSFLKVDSRKKQVTIMDPAVNSQQNQTQKRGSSNQVPPKMFAFDAAFSHDASQLQNQSELRAPTAEKAAFFLDAAIAARYSSKPDYDEEEHRNSHMLFTLHIYQYRMEKTGKGGMSGGRSRLHLIDLGSCVKVLSKTRDSTTGLCLSLSALGNVILALVNGSKHIPYKDSKLTMLLRESLGNMNCRTTMIAHISSSPSNFSETLSTLQIASRVLRLKKKKAKQYTSSSSGGESSCEEGRMRRPTQLRTIHSRNVVDSEMPLLHLSSDPEEYSSSEQSCDTVIYVGPNGSALSDKELTDNEGPPEFVPIIPSLHKNKADLGKASLTSQPSQQVVAPLVQASQSVQPLQTINPQPLPPLPEEGAEPGKKEKDCLKCNTFAELQERLDCIDGREEVTTFPFEEVSANRAAKFEPGHGQVVKGGQQSSSPKRISDQQLEEIREVVEEAEIAQSIIESLTQTSTGSCGLSSSRSVTGSSGIGQFIKSSSLHDSKESISGGSSSESKPRPMGSPRLGIASLTKTSEYKPPSSPSQRCKVYTQKGIMPGTPPHSSHNLNKDSRKSSTESLLNPESRTSPVGMSPQVLNRSSSSNSLGSAETLCDDVPQLPLDSKKNVKDTTATVTLEHPLEPSGEDELVFTLVEKLTISGVMENGRPTSIISFNSDCSVQAMTSGSRPVSIISSMSEDLEHYTTAPCTTTATISQVNIAKFLPLRKIEGDAQASRRSSISSWLSEMSAGSDGDQSCHSFVAQQCFGQGEAIAEDRLLEIQEEGDIDPESNDQKNSDKESDSNKTEVNDKNTAKHKLDKLSSTSSGYVPFKTNITTHPCAAVKPIVVQDLQTKTPLVKDPKSPLVPISSEIHFDDPWMKREGCEETKPLEMVCDIKSEKRTSESVKRKWQVDKHSSSEAACSPDSMNRVVNGCEMVFNASESIIQVYSADILRTGSLPRAWHRLNKQDDLDDPTYRYMSGEYKSLGVTTSTPCSPRATLERRSSAGRQGIFARQKGIPPLPPVRKSSLDQRNRASPQHSPGNSQTPNQHLSFIGSTPEDLAGKHKGPNVESSRLFSAKLEQLANRTHSLGRSHGAHYDCHSLEKAEILTSLGSKGGVTKDSTMPRTGRSITRGLLSSPINGPNGNNNAPQLPKASQSKISAVSKLLMASPKARSLSSSCTKTLSFSTKSLPQSVNRSSSLPPNGKNQNQNSWSTQSLSRSRGTGLASKLPLRAVNGRISELLQGSASSRAAQGRGASDTEERGAAVQGEERPVVHTLPSPYSKITAPRRPHRCSSGHASDNSSVLSGELPPAMGKTALFYHSGGSSGYESMIRDSEATGSTSSAQDSMSENISSVSGRRSLKNSKKRSNTVCQISISTLERRSSAGRQGIFARQKGIPPLPPVRKSSLDQRNRASPQHSPGNSQTPNQHLSFIGSTPEDLAGKHKGPNVESSRLFSAKLEQLANRTHSLGRSHGAHYDCHSLEKAEILTSLGSKGGVTKDSTMPRTGRSITRGLLSSPINGPNGNNNAPQLPKASQSKISAVSKLLMASPKARSLSSSCTKTLSFSTKSLPQSVNRSSSLPPNGKNQNQNSWSTQSLSRSRGTGLASKLPLRAVNGRISELLQGSASSRAAQGRGASDTEERGAAVQGEERPVVHTLPSPYSKITAPRRPHRCSSGHASDNSSVLSGELPPAMGKTALFYHSGGSSGYESMIRDSEATGSTSSAQDSMSENISSVSGRRSLKNSKKRSNTGSQRRRLIPNLTLDTTSPVRMPVISPGLRWVDVPLRPTQRGLVEPFEIKVYEIDDVERLQRRRTVGNKEVVYFSAKLKILEHRQQRISEVRAKYDWLKKELEQTKQHLMLEPEKWTTEFDLQQTFEVDSLEYLEALEFVTERLENRVNFCKAHLMMITCFDITCRRR
ncbi:kinesin-like protein KIF26B [Sinocyclocheilus grahami]|uniref:kinesin-like protein KIF26B n=1 Tax=Sinocyclocheilus grahami TaxID=75366 RepID=UPI0007ACD4D6|nr:PREDICTED: kinesin-like protein KIF26B [Sinocyclocheilus grahami]